MVFNRAKIFSEIVDGTANGIEILVWRSKDDLQVELLEIKHAERHFSNIEEAKCREDAG
jgi:hypothetical protein